MCGACCDEWLMGCGGGLRCCELRLKILWLGLVDLIGEQSGVRHDKRWVWMSFGLGRGGGHMRR